jgi:hypothetical protein
MTELRARPLRSYRDDPAVPNFDDKGPIAIMDGNCALRGGSACLNTFWAIPEWICRPFQAAAGIGVAGLMYA